MQTLVTGAAGFIGMHVCRALLKQGHDVLGIDNMNTYYDPLLKKVRLAELEKLSNSKETANFKFHLIDIADKGEVEKLSNHEKFDRIIHLAAQAGVRHSIENPHAYVHSNLVGHLNILEMARKKQGIKHLVYASSSSVYGSVYGGNTNAQMSEQDSVDKPISLYAATKRADELMSYTYAYLYGIPQTGLRFFTVYGPWGRPDMAPWLFTEAILEGRPIQIYNQGHMSRDFTYIDDITDGVIKAIDHPPSQNGENTLHKIYNIGNNQPEQLMKFIEIIEEITGKKAVKDFRPMQPGDVQSTCANIDAIKHDLNFSPKTPLYEGLGNFIDWYKTYKGLTAF